MCPSFVCDPCVAPSSPAVDQRVGGGRWEGIENSGRASASATPAVSGKISGSRAELDMWELIV